MGEEAEVRAAYRVWSARQARDPGPLATFDAGWQACLTWIDQAAEAILAGETTSAPRLTVVR